MKNKKAFTLIEILLVVAIVGLLASIVLVNAGTWRLSAQRSAVLTEISSALRAIEECNLTGRALFCNGTTGVISSGQNCAGSNTATSKPVAGASICGSISGSPTWSESVWPDVSRNSYVYGNYAGSQVSRNLYNFSVFKDANGDGDPDDGLAFCCTSGNCLEITDSQTLPGTVCRGSSGISAED